MKKILITLVFFLPMLSYGTIHYVSESGSGLKNGVNWANAYDNSQLQSVISAALTGDEVWIAKGTYKPTSFVDGTSDRHRSFQLKNNVAVYGGFSGNETSLSQRNSYGRGMINETLLSGDIGTTGNSYDNCFHVFHHPDGLSLNNTALLDGVTITGGNADFISCSQCTDQQRKGGGMFNENSEPTLTNIIFYANNAIDGGGFSSWGPNANSVLTNVTFISNTASSGGGMASTWFASPVINNAIFTLNSAYYGGAIAINNSGMILNNTTFASNTATHQGGGVYISNAYPIFNNCIIWGNSAPTAMQLYNEYNSATLNYTCYANDVNDVVIGIDGTLNALYCITSDPQFVDATNGNFQLYSTSPCLDAGNDAANSTAYDYRGEGFARKLLKTDHTQVGTIDMGAYEFNLGCDPISSNRIFVNASMNDDNGSGRNWYTAKKTLQAALDIATAGDTIWVAKGTYKPTLQIGGVGERFKTFQMKNNVAIFGGFAGNEVTLGQRTQFGEGQSNETILSGDVIVPGVNTDNCYHVFYHHEGLALNNSAVLDGFTITGGYADGTTEPFNLGGGIYNKSCSPTINNVVFVSNFAAMGGALYNEGASPIITNSIFKSNAAFWGGAISNRGFSAPSFTNVKISSNSASTNYGGGIYNHNASPVLTNVLINSNDAWQLGGGIFSESSTTTLNNVTIVSNTAGNGGGVYNIGTTSAFNNCILWENAAAANGHNVYLHSGTITMNYSCYGNAVNEVYLVEATFNRSNNNIVTNPQFFDVPSIDYSLLENSPCIGAGNNSYNTTSTDLAGNLRIMGTNIDMGAYEWDSGIENTISIADSVITSGNNTCFNAYDTISMAGTDIVIIENTATAEIIAGKCIRFLPGFHAQSGSYVNAYITNDNSFCEVPPEPIIANTLPEEKSLYIEEDDDDINIPEQSSSIKVYPNPNNGKFTLKLVHINEYASINIYNILGECIYQCSPNNQIEVNIELTEVKKGIYFVKVNNGDSILTRKMIIG